ncbi:pre-mRNA cleavage complex 2 protein Pcf11-like [Aethina tumida]|uniref:pre-mRNA cleavage complex 2 protein Pcf11-like n=1 Tax=Aethina tumida TaxID=116153 RepID=UPI00214752F7|nr:pre-mRNA cleavage complex 2 protein Pcf11-like [Aethina tumida]
MNSNYNQDILQQNMRLLAEKKAELAALMKKRDYLVYLQKLQTNTASGHVPFTRVPHQRRQDNFHKPERKPYVRGKRYADNKIQNPPPSPVTEEKPVVLSFSDPASLKVRSRSGITALYSGKQCSTCGQRFSAKDADSYTKHLDWHFRQNRANKKGTGRRAWYYSKNDWMEYEASYDVEEAENFFDLQAKAIKAEKVEDVNAGVTVSASNGDKCTVCQEKFEEYFDDDEEEWRLRDAMVVDGKLVHPQCKEN